MQLANAKSLIGEYVTIGARSSAMVLAADAGGRYTRPRKGTWALLSGRHDKSEWVDVTDEPDIDLIEPTFGRRVRPSKR
jgi:hypothetical protein